jgi:Protein of unknown function (DUF4238)
MKHHYVPEWYQRRFLKTGKYRYHYLDLHPEIIVNHGHKYRRNARHKWGPDRCFCEEGLYALKLGNLSSDEIERRFFGSIDTQGRKAVQTFGEYSGVNERVVKGFQALLLYMNAQRFRTQRGLEYIGSQGDVRDRNMVLILMQRLFQIYGTMWSEGIWEIVFARQSPTKFIVSDDPVTLFNSRMFPHELKYPLDVPLEVAGTRTLFPLGSEACLIITHLQLVRNPHVNPMTSRINARFFARTMKALLDIQFGRELEEDEVLRINYILKRRAVRYIAAAEERWLYPEDYVSTRVWSKLDDDWFLLPNPYKVPFHSEIMVGYKDGSAWGMDEYGRLPEDPQNRNHELREKESITNRGTELEFAKKRRGKSIAHVDKLHDYAYFDQKLMEDGARESKRRKD